MSEVKQLDPIAVCRLIVKLAPSDVDEAELRAIFGGVVLKSMSEVAQAFNVSAATVRNTWRRDGMPGTAKRGTTKENKFPLADVLLWWLKRHVDVSKARGADQYTDRLRLAEVTRAEATAKREVRRLQAEEGRHVEIDIVRSEWAEALTTLRDGILEIPRHVKPMLPAKVADQTVAEMDRLIRHKLTRLSEQPVTDFVKGEHRNGNGHHKGLSN
jgi:phage terminase Nu1 subunit (DNA packaging protein)